MSLPADNSRLIIESSSPGDLHETNFGTIANVSEDTIVVCFDDPVDWHPGEELSIGFQDPGTHRFLRAPGRLLTILSHEPKVVVQILMTGCFVLAERRSYPRLDPQNLQLRVRFGTNRDCTLADMSGGGVAVITTDELPVDTDVPIGIEYMGHRCSGVGRIRHRSQLSNGSYVYGIEIPAHEATFRSWLKRACSYIARRQQMVRGLLESSDLRQLFEGTARSTAYTSPHPSTPEDDSLPSWVNVMLPIRSLLELPLPGSMLDESGNVIRHRGEILSPEDLEGLKGRNVVLGPEWFSEDRVPLLDESGDSYDRSLERRLFDRSDWQIDGTVQILGGKDSRSFSVATLDLSPGGISFRSPFYIATATRLRIDVQLSGEPYCAIGEVVSCRLEESESSTECETEAMTYRVGVRFVESILETNSKNAWSHR